MRIAAIVALLLVLAPPGQTGEHASSPPHAAARARLAADTLLNDVARAGRRWVAVGAWGNVVLSDDEGLSWRQAEAVPTRRTLTSVHFVDEKHGWSVGHDAVVLHSADGGSHWEIQFRAPDADAPLLSVWFEDARHGLAVGGFGLLVETWDGGQTWLRRRLGDDEEEPHLNEVFPGPGGTLFVAAEFGVAFRSSDRGATWTPLRLPYEGSLWTGLALESARRVLMFGMRGHAFRSDDLGESTAAAEASDGGLVLFGERGARRERIGD
jgi:photosystem II stability/assembly factor-like uncharacterized protein